MKDLVVFGEELAKTNKEELKSIGTQIHSLTESHNKLSDTLKIIERTKANRVDTDALEKNQTEITGKISQDSKGFKI